MKPARNPAPGYHSAWEDAPVPTRPLPESVKQLARERPCFVQTQPRALIWPLRAADGRTWWQVKADKENAVDRG